MNYKLLFSQWKTTLLITETSNVSSTCHIQKHRFGISHLYNIACCDSHLLILQSFSTLLIALVTIVLIKCYVCGYYEHYGPPETVLSRLETEIVWKEYTGRLVSTWRKVSFYAIFCLFTLFNYIRNKKIKKIIYFI